MIPDLVVGLGCRPGASADEVAAVLGAALGRRGWDARRVLAFATVAARADEPGLRAVAGAALLAYPAEVLAGVAVPNPSAVVAAALGTGSVAEAAAVHAATALAGPGVAVALVGPKLAGRSVTVALARIGRCPPGP